MEELSKWACTLRATLLDQNRGFFFFFFFFLFFCFVLFLLFSHHYYPVSCPTFIKGFDGESDGEMDPSKKWVTLR